MVIDYDNVPYRFPTRAATDYWGEIFQLDPDISRHAQDWELEVTDADRTKEFVDAYTTTARNDDDRFALMALIIASYDDLLYEGGDEILWNRIRVLLLANFETHLYTIVYWCCDGATDPEYQFAVTSHMQGVLREAVEQRSSGRHNM